MHTNAVACLYRQGTNELTPWEICYGEGCDDIVVSMMSLFEETHPGLSFSDTEGISTMIGIPTSHEMILIGRILEIPADVVTAENWLEFDYDDFLRENLNA